MTERLTLPEKPSGLSRFVPGVGSIVEGARHSAGVDLRAALTVWAVVVPQSLAYATLAGMPSVHGLYAAMVAASEPPATTLLIDAEGMSDIDTTAAQQLGELLDDLDAVGIDVSWARVRQPVLDMLERSGLMDRMGQDHVFLEVDDAVSDFLDS